MMLCRITSSQWTSQLHVETATEIRGTAVDHALETLFTLVK